MEQEDDSYKTSWVTRTRFSRAVCYRSCTVVAPLTSFDLSVEIESLRRRKKKDAFTSGRRLSFQGGTNDSKECNVSPDESVEHQPDFSFPSPFSPTLETPTISVSSYKNFDCSSSYDSLRDEEPCSAHSSMVTSPSSSSCFSRSSTGDSRSPHLSWKSNGEECGTGGHKFDVKRVPSWSEYFQTYGGERAVVSAEKWMVDLSKLLLGERFASGAHSRLYHGIYKDDPVAVKVIRQPDEDQVLSDQFERLFTQEVTLLSCLHHRNVVKFIAACKKPPVLCVIMEYLSGGSLRAFLSKKNAESRPLKQVVGMAIDIASGMEYLHTKGVIHRDLKTENLILSEDFHVKVIDFGVACYESQCDYMDDDPGTYRWMAPEMICRKHYNRKVDVYSFGIVLWELLSGRLPFEDMSAVQAAFATVHKNARPQVPPGCPEPLEGLMHRCWSVDPDQRPEFWEILRWLQVFEDSLEGNCVPFSSWQCSLYSTNCLPVWLKSDKEILE